MNDFCTIITIWIVHDYSWYLCYICHLLELRFICIKISLNMILGISKLNWVIYGNSEITMRWHGGYIDNFQMFRTRQDFVCILRHCMHKLQMNPQNGYRVLITVEHFFFMLIKLKCTGYRVIIYNCVGTGAALSFHVKLSLFSLYFFFKLTKKINHKITCRKLS